jgi:flagellar export protein FliJ
MRPFQFRAQAALDLRRKQEDDVRRLLAEAQTAHDAAQARAVAADLTARNAADDFVTAQRTGTEAWRLAWHQSWITKLRLEADGCQRLTAISAATVERATASVITAYQRRRTLERLRDRARRRYDTEASRRHNQEMNALASLRFAARLVERGGRNSDDESDLIDSIGNTGHSAH